MARKKAKDYIIGLNQWIPVEVALPIVYHEEKTDGVLEYVSSDPVLVTGRDKDGSAKIFITRYYHVIECINADGEHQNETWEFSGSTDITVTAWMQIPFPYGERGGAWDAFNSYQMIAQDNY